MKTRRGVTLVVASLLGAGCSLGPAPRAPLARYDLGTPPDPNVEQVGRMPFVFVVHEPTGPSWLDGGDMTYRLSYDEPERVRRYANSQWAISPLGLVAERLRKGLGARSERGGALPDIGIPADYWVRVTVEEFSQVFDAPGVARGVVRLRVVLTKGRAHAFVAQQGFFAQIAAGTPDARGGVVALKSALDDAVAQITAWISGLVGEAAKTGAAGR
jgi:cholesterol transport system auxiliary component